MSFLNVGIDIKAHNADALRGIAAVKLALMGLRREQGISAQRSKELTRQNNELNHALDRQSRALKGLTLQWGQLRRLTLTFAFRSAVLGITALVASLNSLVAAAGGAAASLANLSAASIMGGVQGLAAFGQVVTVLSFGLKDLAKAYVTFGTIHATTMKKLTKPAQQFYKQTKDLRNGIKELKVLSQQGMFPGLLKAYEHMKVLGPIVAQTVYDTATSIGYLADRAGEMAEKRAPLLERMLNRNTLTIQRMGAATEDLIAGMLTYFDKGGPMLDHMSSGIAKFASNAKKSLSEWGKDGSLDKFFKNLRKSWDNWTSILGSTAKGLFNFWTALQPVTHQIENAVERTADKFDKWTGKTENQDKITKFFRNSLKPMGAFLHLVGDLGKLWAEWAKKGNDDAVRLFNGLDTNLLPILKELGDYFDKTLLPRVGDLAGAFLDFIRAALPSVKNFLTILQPIGRTIQGVLQIAADLVDMFNDLGPASGVIGTMMVGAAILSSWHKLKTAISLTIMAARAGMGVEGAVMPRRQAFRATIPGMGFAAASRSLFSNSASVPGYVNDRYRESVDRGAERAGIVPPYARTSVPGRRVRFGTVAQRMQSAGLVAPSGYMLDRQLTPMPGGVRGAVRSVTPRAASVGGVVLPSSSVSTMETQIAKGSKSGLLRGLKAAAGGLAASGIPQAIGLSIALVAGPAIVSAGLNVVKDKRPKVQQEVGNLGGDLRFGMAGAAKAFNDTRLKNINDQLGEFIQKGNSEGMRGIAKNLQNIADATKDIGKQKGLEKAAADVRTLAVRTDTALLGKTAPAFEEFSKRGDKSIDTVLDGLSVLQAKIYNEIPNTDAPAYRDAMASSFHAAALAVKSAMDAGLISIKKGTREYRKLLSEQFKALGFTPQQVKNLVATGGVDPTGKKGGSENPGGASVNYGPQNPVSPGAGSGPKGKAIGGGFYLGNKGERGFDDIPMNIAGQNIVAGRGEYVGIFNSHQQKAFSQMASRFGYGGMEGFFQANNRPHYMAGGGIVSLGNRLQKMGYEVSEQSHFGGVHPVHVPGSYHYKDQALDVSDNLPPFAFGNGSEAASLDHLAAILKHEGWHYLWRVPNHFDHLHVDTAQGVHGLPGGGNASLLKRIMLGGSGVLKGIAQGILDRYRSGANSVLSKASDVIGGELSGEVEGSVGSYDGPLNHLFPSHFLGQGGSQLSSKQVQAIARSVGLPPRIFDLIAKGESGRDPGVQQRDPGDGNVGYGLFQITPHSWGKGPALSYFNQLGGVPAMFNPVINAKMAKFLYEHAASKTPKTPGFPWFGTSFLSGGGLIKAASGMLFGGPPPIGQGYPGVDPNDANTPADKIIADKKKKAKKEADKKKKAAAKKHHHMEKQPALGQGYSRQDFANKSKHKIKMRKFVNKMLHKKFKLSGGVHIDPVTGEASYKIENKFNAYQKLIDRWGTDVNLLQGQYDDAEGASPGSGFGLLDDILAVHEGTDGKHVFDGGKGKGILGALMYQMGTLGSGGNINLAVKERRARLTKMRKIVIKNASLRKKYDAKMKKMKGGGVGWKSAVGHNESIIREWQRWKRDSDETPAERRQADHEIDRLGDENRWLTAHKPAKLSTGSAQYRNTYDAWYQRGLENKGIVGDFGATGWHPAQIADNSAAGKVLRSLGYWNDIKDFRDSNYDSVRQTYQDEGTEINRLRRQIGLGPNPDAAGAGSSERDDLLKSIGEDTLRDRFRSGLNFDALRDFAQLLGMRSIGAFAHGGPIRETGVALLHRGEYVVPAPDGPFGRGMNAATTVNSSPQITLVLRDKAGALIELVDARIDNKSAAVTNRQVGRSARHISVAPGRR